MVLGLLPLLSLWPTLGLFDRSSENEDCLRLRVAGGEGGCSDSGSITAEATALQGNMVSKTGLDYLLMGISQWCFRHDMEIQREKNALYCVM